MVFSIFFSGMGERSVKTASSIFFSGMDERNQTFYSGCKIELYGLFQFVIWLFEM
jgi:hypothetical protein